MEKYCPLCKSQLSLKQINFTTAVFICLDLKCQYPVGFDCIEVERPLDKMNDKEDNFDTWLNSICDNMTFNSKETNQNLKCSDALSKSNDLNKVDCSAELDDIFKLLNDY